MLKKVNIYNDTDIALKSRIANYAYLGYHFLIRSDMDVFLTPLFLI